MDSQALKSHLKPMEPQPTLLAAEGRLRSPITCLLCDIYGTLLISGSGDIGISRGQAAEENSLNRLLADYEINRPLAELRHVGFLLVFGLYMGGVGLRCFALSPNRVQLGAEEGSSRGVIRSSIMFPTPVCMLGIR